MMERTHLKRRSFATLYKVLAFFMMIYGLIGSIFYMSTLLFPAFFNGVKVVLGYNSFKPDALIFLLVVQSAIYFSIFVDGVLFLKKSSYAVSGYFFILLVYYSVRIWVTGSLNILYLFITIGYGLLLLFFFKKISGD